MITKPPFSSLAAFLVFFGIFAGCQTPTSKPAPGTSVGNATRNNCYSLLHQLLDDQKDVSLLRFIKREQEDVKELVKRIASTSGAGAKRLEEFAKADSSIRLDALQLPPGETATREAIASTKKKGLLGQSGARFELSLLLAEAEALSYASHLAKVAAQNEPQSERAQVLVAIGDEMRAFHHEVFELLLAKGRTVTPGIDRSPKK